MADFIRLSIENGIAQLVLNRPDKRNAMHGPLITEISAALRDFAKAESRVLLIQGEGEHFCAGADIAWMQNMATLSADENYDDAEALADLLYQLHVFPGPVIVLAQGVTLGGGLGLLAAADIAIAAENATFGLPEVKMGLVPAVISPYVMAAIGARWARYYFLSGEKFGADTALRLGLVHQVTAATALLPAGLAMAATLKENGPQALQAVKKLVDHVTLEKITPALAQKTAQHLAEIRLTAEAQEGLQSFLQKRKPKWLEN